MPRWCLPAQAGNGRQSIFYVYLIKSTFKNWTYVGFSENIWRRIKQHNSGQTKSTKPYKPFNVLFVQEVHIRTEARSLEKYLKVRFNKESLLQVIAEVVEWQTPGP